MVWYSDVRRKFPRRGSKHRRSHGRAKGSMPPPKFEENIVILCFERRFSKQNSVIRLKLNILVYTAEYWQYTLPKLFIHFLFLGSEVRAMAQWPPPPYASGLVIQFSKQTSVGNQARRHWGIDGLSPAKKLQIPQNWNMKPINQGIFGQILECQSNCTNAVSQLNTFWRWFCW